MNTWAIDQLKEAQDLLVRSNNTQLNTTTITTQEERDEMNRHYTAISRILLKAIRQHTKEQKGGIRARKQLSI